MSAYDQFRSELVNHEFRMNPILIRDAQKFLHNAVKVWRSQKLLHIMNSGDVKFAQLDEENLYLEPTKDPLKETVIFVSVHIRRGDYGDWLQEQLDGYLVTKMYFVEAMHWFRTKVNALFEVIII